MVFARGLVVVSGTMVVILFLKDTRSVKYSSASLVSSGHKGWEVSPSYRGICFGPSQRLSYLIIFVISEILTNLVRSM